jgi:hypothetical protein
MDLIRKFYRKPTEDHYVYPCQRFSSGNTLEDYNPESKCQQSFPLILITKKDVNLISYYL